MHELVEQDIQTLWDYMYVGRPPHKADCLWVIGCWDNHVALHAARMTQQFHYWYIVITGEPYDSQPSIVTANPAEDCAHIMQQQGMLKSPLLDTTPHMLRDAIPAVFAILQSQNTPMPLTIQLVTRPYMERQAIALCRALWPDRDASWYVTSPRVPWQQYVSYPELRERIVNEMVGAMHDVIRIAVPDETANSHALESARAAYDRLVAAGYTKNLMHK